MNAEGQVGPQILQDGAHNPVRLGRLGSLIIAELHGRFYEQTFRGNTFSTGMTITALSANTITLTASTTPILGVWNPGNSTVNLAIMQATLSYFANTLTTPAPPGVFVWASSFGNNAISTGNAPYNRKTMSSVGSSAKAFNLSPALTGLTNNLVIFEAMDIPQPGTLAAGTITASTTTSNATVGQLGVQNFDGSLIVPPGGVLALLNTTSSTTYSVTGRLLWEEVPL